MPPSGPDPRLVIAIILPPREGFSPGDAGAIGLMVQRLAHVTAGFAPVAVGAPAATGFADVAYRPARLSWWPAGHARRYAGGVLRVLRAIGPAVIEVHNRPDIALFLARHCPAIPVMLFLHNDPQGMRRARTPAMRGDLLARLASIVTVSDWVRARLLDGCPPPARLPVTLPNCLDPGDLPPSPSVRADEILFAGRIVADKGADGFVDACALALPQLAGWHATMIGADRFGPDSPETPWLHALRPKAAAAGVIMQGYQPHARVMQAMAQAAIVVVPSRWPEPFGLTALEAMATGAALLCSNRGGLAEVTGAAAVVIDPENPAAIAAEIVALARDPARRAVLGAAGRARAAQFSLPAAQARLDAHRINVLRAWPSARRHSI